MAKVRAKTTARAATAGKLAAKPKLKIKAVKEPTFKTVQTIAIKDYAGNGTPNADVVNTIESANQLGQRIGQHVKWEYANYNKDAQAWLFLNSGKAGINDEDFIFYAGHGGPQGPILGSDAAYTGDGGKAMQCADYDWGGKRLKWALFNACLLLDDGARVNTAPTWKDPAADGMSLLRWGPALRGLAGSLHGIFGHRALAYDVADTGAHFVDNVYDRQYRVGQAWIDAVDWTQYYGGWLSGGTCPATLTAYQVQPDGFADWYYEDLRAPWIDPSMCDPASLRYSFTWLWQGTPKFAAKKKKAAAIERMPVFEAAIASKKDLDEIAARLTELLAKQGKQIKTVDESTGSFLVEDATLRKVTVNLPLAAGGRKRPAKPPAKIATEKQAITLAKRVFSKLALPDAGEAGVRIDKLQRATTAERKAQVLETHVVYTRAPGGFPVIGPAGRVAVRAGDARNVARVHVDWPQWQTVGELAIVSEEIARARFNRTLDELNATIFVGNQIRSFAPKKTELGYAAELTSEQTRVLKPAYLYSGTLTFDDGKTRELTIPVAATALPLARRRMSTAIQAPKPAARE